jgi:uncharacterized protein YegJ (DUF2314 family)
MQAMDLTARAKRRIVYAAAALALLGVGKAFGLKLGSSSSGSPEASGDSETSHPAGSALTSATLAIVRLRHPPSATAELGVLTDLPEGSLSAVLDRAAVAALVTPALCGDEDACAAVRAAIQDEHTTTLSVLPGSSWNLETLDLDASAAGLSARERSSVAKRAHVVVVRVATAPSPRQLAVRASFAAAAAIAAKIDGLVYDQLLDRIETARAFATHAVTAPLAASAFRKDRIAMLYQPRSQGIVRILTAGLARWGGPDVEAQAVPTAAAERVADIVLGVAEAIANGANTGPVTLSRDDLARARGEPYAPDPSLPDAGALAVELLSVHPEGGDPNDFMARIAPPAGTGPLSFLDLAERYFGAELAAAPDEATLRAARDKAQRELPAALARWTATRANGGSTLLVRLPFDIAGDGGTESMWIDVTRYDTRSVTGRLVDDPLGATQFTQGDEITRPRTDVEEVDERDRGDR